MVVAGVQEETWPDLRLRGSLLGVDELAEAASGAPSTADDAAAAALASKLLAEERQAVLRSRDPGQALAAGHRGRRRRVRHPAVPVPG